MPDQKNRSNTLYFQGKNSCLEQEGDFSTGSGVTSFETNPGILIGIYAVPGKMLGNFYASSRVFNFRARLWRTKRTRLEVHGVLRNHSCQSRTLGLFSGNALYLSYF
ncbi:uncharacterized protein LOC116842095 isoform X2 [Odontomachus brunneus]|uniref:uncharacterized protein LOC116842095 isoform X2 n=1 Tax=Odontomachus brunneus TaxID=486640 RepID=UPI0013F21AF1|nr:uncharacterized protein LOC116842095 isoform X2 [Odontomachus brunneus]